jgi:uncharacterized beta barrel domain-containing protein DUF5777
VPRLPKGPCVLWLIAAMFAVCLAVPATAQTPAQPPPERSDPDAPVDPLQPDFNLVALPTTLRMPVGKWAFRVTHRFTRPLGQGDFGALLADAFGFDSSAQIGLELRFGLLRGAQIGVHRTSDRTIQVFGQYSVLSERHGGAAGFDVLVALEGENNLRDQHKAAVGAVVSRNLGRRAAVYAEPIWIGNTNAADIDGVDDNSLLLGLGARVRVRPSTYLVAEITPRLAGYDPGVNQISFGLESRAGGHLFQLNVSNGFGTTLGQLARGGFSNDDWYIGFNIARKFF